MQVLNQHDSPMLQTKAKDNLAYLNLSHVNLQGMLIHAQETLRGTHLC